MLDNFFARFNIVSSLQGSYFHWNYSLMWKHLRAFNFYLLYECKTFRMTKLVVWWLQQGSFPSHRIHYKKLSLLYHHTKNKLEITLQISHNAAIHRLFAKTSFVF